ncbi:Variable outer membrane protein [Borrelia duttonii CR2A]|uniref:Variable large protein n=1 Tax=Borrelia duttonii CR2A TaxID=1432657 RepID=W6TW24_9SPIR|nr:Variable outer membrane protein [Borrelia duttonii CR2A]
MEVFVSFGDMITGTLGIKADTKKSDIGVYFIKISEIMKVVKGKLGEILEQNGNYEKVKSKVEEFIEQIGKIEEGAKEAASGASGSELIGNAVKDQEAVPADAASINSLVKGIKGIVGVVLKKDEGNAEATKTGDTEQKSIGKLFSSKKDTDGTEAQAAALGVTIGAVSGADIFASYCQVWGGY